MKQVERHAPPAVGNAIGLLIALWAIDHFAWLPADQGEFIVAAFGTLCIHALMQGKAIVKWIAARYNRPLP